MVVARTRVVVAACVGLVVFGVTMALAPWQVAAMASWDVAAAIVVTWVIVGGLDEEQRGNAKRWP